MLEQIERTVINVILSGKNGTKVTWKKSHKFLVFSRALIHVMYVGECVYLHIDYTHIFIFIHLYSRVYSFNIMVNYKTYDYLHIHSRNKSC